MATRSPTLVASAGPLRSQVELWRKNTKSDTKGFAFVDADDATNTVLFTVDAKLVKVHPPKTKESMWMIESDEQALLEFVTTVSSWYEPAHSSQLRLQQLARSPLMDVLCVRVCLRVRVSAGRWIRARK
jgi:hypothetical protein